MNLYAVTGKDGQILLAYPATQFNNEQSLMLKELHTYDPATQGVYEKGKQVVLDVDAYNLSRALIKEHSLCGTSEIAIDVYNKFLSAGKEAT